MLELGCLSAVVTSEIMILENSLIPLSLQAVCIFTAPSLHAFVSGAAIIVQLCQVKWWKHRHRQIKYRPEKASTAEFWELPVFLAEQCQKIISSRSRKCSCVMLSHDLPCYVNLT